MTHSKPSCSDHGGRKIVVQAGFYMLDHWSPVDLELLRKLAHLANFWSRFSLKYWILQFVYVRDFVLEELV